MSLAFLSQNCSDKVKTGDSMSYYVKKCTGKDQAAQNDNCSAFCNCSCCGTTIADVGTDIIHTDIPLAHSIEYSAIAASPLSTMPGYFWQPPQLV